MFTCAHDSRGGKRQYSRKRGSKGIRWAPYRLVPPTDRMPSVYCLDARSPNECIHAHVMHMTCASRTTIENFRSKFAREPTYFQEFLDPTKKRKRNLHKFLTGPSPIALLGAHGSFYTFCIRDSRTGNYSNSLNSVSQCTTASYRLLVFDSLFWIDLSG